MTRRSTALDRLADRYPTFWRLYVPVVVTVTLVIQATGWRVC